MSKKRGMQGEAALIYQWMRHLHGNEWKAGGRTAERLESFLRGRHGQCSPDAISRAVKMPLGIDLAWAETLTVSTHAIKRWKERSGSKLRYEAAGKRLLDLFCKTQEVFLRDEKKVSQMLNHSCKPARYFRDNSGWIFVVADGQIKTVHPGEDKKFTAINSQSQAAQ